MKIVIDRDAKDFGDSLLNFGKENIVYLEEGSQPDLKEEDTVVYFTTLQQGGLGYQAEMFSHNPKVKKWILISGKNKPMKGFLAALGTAAKRLKWEVFPDFEADRMWTWLSAQLGREEKTCGIRYAEEMRDEKLEETLKRFLPDWTFKILELEGEVFCEKQIVVMGKRGFPSKVGGWKTDEQTAYVYSSQEVDPRMRLEEKEWKSYFKKKGQIFFAVDARYENWRCLGETNESALAGIVKEEDFVMWDEYGLPLLKEEYTREKVKAFLSRFTDIYDLSQWICG